MSQPNTFMCALFRPHNRRAPVSHTNSSHSHTSIYLASLPIPPTSPKPPHIPNPTKTQKLRLQPIRRPIPNHPSYPGDKVVLIEDETPNGSTTVTEERRPPTIIQAGGGIVGVGVGSSAATAAAAAAVGSRRRPLSSRISKANRDLHAPDNDPGHSYSQVDQYDDDVAGYYDEDDRDS